MLLLQPPSTRASGEIGLTIGPGELDGRVVEKVSLVSIGWSLPRSKKK